MRPTLVPGVPVSYARRRINAPTAGVPQPNTANDGLGSSVLILGTATASASADTKGAWAQLIGATTADSTWMTLFVQSDSTVSGTDNSILLDVGTGAGGSEVVVIPNISMGGVVGNTTGGQQMKFSFPIFIPSGTRVAVRIQSKVGSRTLGVGVMFGRLPHVGTARTSLVNIGADTGNSRGTVLSVPGAINNEGAWTQLTAASAVALGAIAVFVDQGGDTTQATASQFVDIGIGGSGSETVIAENLFVTTTTAELTFVQSTNLFPVNIPAGVRISARYQSTNLGSSLGVSLIGVPIGGSYL